MATIVPQYYQLLLQQVSSFLYELRICEMCYSFSRNKENPFNVTVNIFVAI